MYKYLLSLLISIIALKATAQNVFYVATNENVYIGTSETLKVLGDLTNNGSITGPGTLSLSGTSAQTISGTGTINNITINNSNVGGVNISSSSTKQYITGVFTPTSGVTTTNGNLVFRSTASSEGVVGTINTCPTEPISGLVTVEKYIPAKRAFRFLTPGVSTTSTIKANWQEGSSVSSTVGYPYTSGTENPVSGFGTHITGAGGAANGFDATITNNPSLFTFNPTTNLWVEATTTNAPTDVLSQGEAYRILIRGSRAVDMNNNAATPDATVLRTTGTMNFCTARTLSTSSAIKLNSGASGYSFIGNPYWSVVDWHGISKSGVEDNLYYWDPAMNGTNGRGAFVTYNPTNGPSIGTSQVSRYIQPGQAFFVKNTNASPALTFATSNIVGSSPTRTFIFGANKIAADSEPVKENISSGSDTTITAVEKIYVSLLVKNRLSSGPADGFLVAYANNFSDEYGREDAAKFGNLDENISALYRGRQQSILGLQSISGNQLKSDTIPVSMSNLYEGDYVMRVSVDKSVDPSREILVLNRTTNQHYRVDHANGLDHSFMINAGIKTKDDLALVVNSIGVESPASLLRKSLVVYPNPVTTGRVDFVVPGTEGGTTLRYSTVRMKLIDATGQVILSQDVKLDALGKGSIDLTKVPSGGYVVIIYSEKQMFTSKIIKI